MLIHTFLHYGMTSLVQALVHLPRRTFTLSWHRLCGLKERESWPTAKIVTQYDDIACRLAYPYALKDSATGDRQTVVYYNISND